MRTDLTALGVLCSLVACFAQVPHLGRCPKVDVVQNLNVKRYLGGWYEVRKFFFAIELGESCITANYSLKADGHIQVLNRGVKSDGSQAEAIGDAYPEDASVPAKLAVSFNNSPRVPYWVVDTDYDSYSLVWSCTDFIGLVQADFAWILSRKRTLDKSIINKLEAKLAGYGIDTSSFMDTEQSSCSN